MYSEMDRSRACYFLKTLAQVERHIVSKRKEKKELDEQKDFITEQLAVLNQWIDILVKAAESGKRTHLFEGDFVRQGLTINKRLQMLEKEQKLFCEKYHNVKAKLELVQMKIENLEEQYNLLIMQEKNLYDNLIQDNWV